MGRFPLRPPPDVEVLFSVETHVRYLRDSEKLARSRGLFQEADFLRQVADAFEKGVVDFRLIEICSGLRDFLSGTHPEFLEHASDLVPRAR